MDRELEASQLVSVDEELRLATIELNEAYKRYQAAILARIAMREMMRMWVS